MVCPKCGATIVPGRDRCVVCHTSLVDTVANAPTVGGVVGNEPLLVPGQQFAHRYRIIGFLGSGGMATVYHAWDETLATAVALKLIRAGAGTSSFEVRQLEERFKRELKLARQVTHPNVIRIHDLGEVEGTLYFTMEYVQGANLATLLEREPKLALTRAVGLARQIASGLAAAHRVGVVHRDLKPANIMIDAQDHARLADFGIARSTSAATLQTVPGSVIGTLDYMAPEQARGGAADERADVYAFGLILYELLAGGRPSYSQEGGLPSLLVRLEKGPPPLTSVVPDVPPALERIVNKCLSASPDARYPTGNELLAELEALDESGRGQLPKRRAPAWAYFAAVLLAGSLLVGGTWWLASTPSESALQAARAPLPILVVDFENRAGERVFGGALEQALSTAMEGAPFITAFPRRDALALIQDLKIGSRLDENTGKLLGIRQGIPVILVGTIERKGSGYEVVVRAVNADKPDPITIARAAASDQARVLGAIAKVAEDVREALGDATAIGSASRETFTTVSLEAVRAYTLAQDLSSNLRDTEAVVQYREALRLDPEFGRAYSGLGASLYRLGRVDEALRNLDQALARTDRMTEREKLRTVGVYFAIARNYDKAIETYEELVAKFPSDPAGYSNLAISHFSVLNFAKAREYGEKAIQIYPKDHKYRSNLALFAMYAGDFATAGTTAQALIQEDPRVDVSYLPLAIAALSSGDTARARRTFEQAAGAGESGPSLSLIGLADVAMFEGKYAEAIALLPSGVQRDEGQGNLLGAAAKLVALAEAHASHQDWASRDAAMAKLRKLSKQDSTLVPVARLAVAAGRSGEAKAIAAELATRLPAQSRAYGNLIEAEIAMANRQYPAAIDALNTAQKLADLWLVRYALGLAYFQAGNYPEANSEFEKCRARRGEASALFLDDLPTYRYYATLPVLARTRPGDAEAGRASAIRGVPSQPRERTQ